jgi:tRNA threonylcarbamoyladenosine biosynthesis protein TsaE
VETWSVPDEQGMRKLGAALASRFEAGNIVFLEGDLGAGKTTLVRGLLSGLGWDREVRSPTFNLLHTYPSLSPPVVHADLYRVKNWQGIGIEDYLSDWLVLIEWPDRAAGLVAEGRVWRVRIEFAGVGRTVTLIPAS